MKQMTFSPSAKLRQKFLTPLVHGCSYWISNEQLEKLLVWQNANSLSVAQIYTGIRRPLVATLLVWHSF